MKTSLFVILVLLGVMMSMGQEEEPKCDHIGYSPFSLREEICGSDGQTYSNDKHLAFENCLYRREIKKVKNGWCKEEDQKRAEEARRKLMEEYAKKLKQQTASG